MDTSLDTTTAGSPSPDRSRAAYAYDELKRRLLIGDFPLARRLGEVALGELLGMSRTPVREALSRLHVEGLVVRLDEGGFAPAAPDLHTVAELYEVRRSLEFTALHRGGHDPAQLEAIRADWAAMQPPGAEGECGPEFVLHDEDFHLSLALAAGNRSLADLLGQTNERIRFVRMQDFLTADRVSKTISEHLGIVQALLDGESERADRRLRTHLFVSERVVEERAAVALSRMLSVSRHG
jgi:DNA-binding GntR family transcriptional regulator